MDVSVIGKERNIMTVIVHLLYQSGVLNMIVEDGIILGIIAGGREVDAGTKQTTESIYGRFLFSPTGQT